MGEKLRETVISEIPSDELVLAEGVLQSKLLHARRASRHPFKYVITDKGMWLKSKKFLFVKPKVTFLPYTDIKGYKFEKFFSRVFVMFYPVNGKKPRNGIFFDKLEVVTPILDKFIKRLDS